MNDVTVTIPCAGLGDADLFALLKVQDADAWTAVWYRAVLPETRTQSHAEMMRKWNLTAEELMGMLYDEMIGRDKIRLYRNDGNSVIGWLRTYVRGYITHANPAFRREIPLEGACAADDGGGEDAFLEKVSLEVSDSRATNPSLPEDPALRRQEEWQVVQECFEELWRENPLRAYVHLLKLRLNLSSREIKDMLGITSEANVDQLFSRAVKDMRKLKVQHDER